jgi:hypothetical protein
MFQGGLLDAAGGDGEEEEKEKKEKPKTKGCEGCCEATPKE